MNLAAAIYFAGKHRDPFDSACPLARFAETGQVDDRAALDASARMVATTARVLARELCSGRHLLTAQRADEFRAWLGEGAHQEQAA